MPTAVDIDNPHWDAVRGHVTHDKIWGGPVVERWSLDGLRKLDVDRTDLVGRYSWTITDPATVAFIAEHSLGRVVDPLAGSGYWAYLLTQLGVDVVSYDLRPPDKAKNRYHPSGLVHVEVGQGEAAETAARHPDRTLLLAWPPYDRPVGADAIRAYTGGRLIYIGEGGGGCTGDGAMFDLLDADWREVADHRPIQWDGIHDRVTVYDRKR